MIQTKEKHRKRMRDKVIAGAQRYKNRLIGKDFLILCDDGITYDVRFFAKDFIHLTGIYSDLTDERFFEDSSLGILSVGNILEEQKYNWSTLKGKTDRIEFIDQLLYGNVSNSLFMVNLHTNTGHYPVAIRNSDLNTCVGFRDAICRARTLRKYSNSNDADEQKKIVAIFSKQNGASTYDELVYVSDFDILIQKNPAIASIVTSEICDYINSNI